MDYDVIVVGSGPAGASAARASAEKGARVLVIDKRMEIGSPVQCGEAFGKTGLSKSRIRPSKKWVAQELDTACLVAPNGEKVFFKNHAYILERKIFDKYLSIEAARAGADYKVNTFVTDLIYENGRVAGVKTECLGVKEDFRARIVIGADGMESKVGRKAGLSRPLPLKYTGSGIQYEMVNVEIDIPTSEYIFVGTDIAPSGYVWIFPKGDDVANVGLGIVVGKGEPYTAKRYLDRFIKENEMTKKATPINMVAGGIPLSAPLPNTVKDNVMLVGDAARQIYSLAGAGIGYSVHCGDICGEVAGKTISTGNVTQEALMEYDTRWRGMFGPEMELAYRLKEFLVEMSDGDFNDLARVINDIGVENLTDMNFTTMLFEVLIKAKPDFIERLEGFL